MTFFHSILVCIGNNGKHDRIVDMKYDWSKNTLEKYCRDSTSYAQVLSKMGAKVNGSNYSTLKSKIKEYGIDISHMLHQGHNFGKTWTAKRNMEDILVENSSYTNTHNLKTRLWKTNLLKKECYECGITEWRGKPAPLQLDHINGIRSDNRIENLRILCPNCHSQTDTWTGKNKLRKSKPKYPNR